MICGISQLLTNMLHYAFGHDIKITQQQSSAVLYKLTRSGASWESLWPRLFKVRKYSMMTMVHSDFFLDELKYGCGNRPA